MKKNCGFYIVFIFTIVLMLACKQNNNNQKSDNFQTIKDKRTQIKWLGQWYGEGKKESLIREIASDFSFQNQNYEVRILFPQEILKIDANKSTYNSMVGEIQKMINENIWPFDLMLCDSYIYNS